MLWTVLNKKPQQKRQRHIYSYDTNSYQCNLTWAGPGERDREHAKEIFLSCYHWFWPLDSWTKDRWRQSAECETYLSKSPERRKRQTLVWKARKFKKCKQSENAEETQLNTVSIQANGQHNYKLYRVVITRLGKPHINLGLTWRLFGWMTWVAVGKAEAKRVG